MARSSGKVTPKKPLSAPATKRRSIPWSWIYGTVTTLALLLLVGRSWIYPGRTQVSPPITRGELGSVAQGTGIAGTDAIGQPSDPTSIASDSTNDALESAVDPPAEPAPAPSTPPVLTGDLQIAPLGNVAQQLLDEGAAFVVNQETQESFPLLEGLNSLEPGTYTIHFEAPEELEALPEVHVTKGGLRKIQLTTLLRQPFQFPTLPEKVGALATYHGTIWHELWPKEKEISYSIRMQLIQREIAENGRPWDWLKIEITTHDASGDYTEVGVLRIDSDRWRFEHRLEIAKGYVRSSGNSVSMLMRTKDVDTRDLVVDFDARRDTLREIAGNAIPEHRLSLHDFLVLFFGDERVAGAAEPIRKLRAELTKTGDRNSWIQPVTSSNGEVACYVVSSRSKGASMRLPGYFMARRKTEPFGFVLLEVLTPAMKAKCMITGSGIGTVRIEEIHELRQQVIDLAPEEPRKTDLDRAEIPDQIATATWQGIIAISPMPSQILEASAHAMEIEMVDSVPCRWLELEVSSTLEQGEKPHWEGARLLIDAAQYQSLGDRAIKKGWIAFGDKQTVFPFPTDNDAYDIVEQRLILSDDPGFQRFGVLDLISMLFDINVSPMSQLGVLRAKIKALRVGQAPQRSTILIPMPGSTTISGEIWTPPERSPFHYAIRKSSQIPFDLVDVVVEMAPKNRIALQLKHHAWMKEGEIPSMFGSNRSLQDREQSTRDRIDRASLPNWRVWTWKDEQSEFKAFAEYGGTTQWLARIHDRSKVTVILRNRRGEEVRVRSESLEDDDWNWARRGREWASMNEKHQQKQYLLIHDKQFEHQLVFQQLDSPDTHPQDFDKLLPSDKEWIVALRQSRKLPDDWREEPAKWLKFAPWVSNRQR